jgi:hypothetical protein
MTITAFPSAAITLDTGGQAWINPSNATTANFTYATVTSLGIETTDSLAVGNFGLSLTSDDVITNIEVGAAGLTAVSNAIQYKFTLVKDYTNIGTSKSTSRTTGYITAAYAYTSLSGTIGTWGVSSWTYSDFNSNSFGIWLEGISNTSYSPSLSIDYIKIVITLASGSSRVILIGI